ncbi:hypothetical protein, conserved in T. vivax [Trypanosoma vivax Y486]|uniref:Uncharacterized protein n=1 Tax=Trypanosoma vivax (strain Y486) TaxID=1055687 RepID=F9WU03_TRYVY|nr:hypothetical protein, conserved in T. vivax [Trypanosoma vivax Y486]|eukprot:CCD21049.1 hypothetical protein, conserved in T. vivax [Trypanosoma vivax Y486]
MGACIKSFRVFAVLSMAVMSCHAVAAGIAVRNAENILAKSSSELSAICERAGLYKVMNTPFDAVYEVASNMSYSVEEVKLKIEALMETTAAMNDLRINEEVQKAHNSVMNAELQIQNTLNVVGLTKFLVDSHFADAGQNARHVFNRRKDVLYVVLNNFTHCKSVHDKVLREIEAAKEKLGSNMSNLTDWKERAEKIWDQPSEWTRGAIESVKKKHLRPNWDDVREKLKQQLEKVVIPLIPGIFNLTGIGSMANEVEAATTARAKEIVHELVQEHKTLCNVSKQLSPLPSVFDALTSQTLERVAEAKKLAEIGKTYTQTIKGYTAALKAAAPLVQFAFTGKIFNDSDLGTFHLKGAEAAYREVTVIGNRVKDDIREMSESAAEALKYLREQSAKVARRATAISERGIKSFNELKCDTTEGTVMPVGATATIDEASEYLGKHVVVEDLKRNLTFIQSKLKGTREVLDKINKSVELSKAEVDAVDVAKNKLEIAVREEFVRKRKELCDVVKHLNAVKSHHNSLEARAREVQSEVQEAKKYEESAGAEAELIQKYVKNFVSTGARTKAAVVRAMGACRAAEAGVAEKDADVFASAAGACAAAKRADDEGRETEKTSSAVKEFEKKSGFAFAGIRESVRRTAVAEGTALKSKENIAGALHKIEAVVERVNKTFNDAVTKLPALESNGYMKECNKDGTAAAAESTVGAFEVNMQTLLQFANESEGSVVNNSVTVLRESTKQFDNALNEAKKFSAKAKSESEQVKAIRAAIKSSAHVARETVRRAEDAAREAQEAASRVASGCEPLHRQLLSVLSGAV